MENYQICKRCVMDTSDPEITFDEQGICCHCRHFDTKIKPKWRYDEEGARRLEQIMAHIREVCKNKKYDCILGISGGVDSSYLAYLASQVWKLHVLAVHVNAGWNTEIAESNIEKLVKTFNIELYTYVVDWEEVRDLQIAYLKSGLANQDVPQDHVFFAALYKKAINEGIKFVFTGMNYATESILPLSWGYYAMDSYQLKAIHKRFGTRKLKTYQTLSFYERYILIPFIKRIRIIHPLNYLPYDKAKAKETLKKTIHWSDYGLKHGESYFTKFFQNYWLPTRFGYDKRRAHFSSMILAGLMTRDEALAQLEEPLYQPDELQQDIAYICNKLGITMQEFEYYLHMPKKHFKDYPSLYHLENYLRGLVEKPIFQYFGRHYKKMKEI